MEQAIRDLLNAANRAFAASGVRFREYEENGVSVAKIYIPSQPRPVVLTARVALPADVVGGKFAKKVIHKAKKVAKKLAKSKALKKLAKVAIAVAAVVPGGQGVAAAAAAVQMARKLAKVAKSGSPRQKAAAKLIAKAAQRNIQRSREAPAVRPGYPNPSAAELPESGIQSNGFADADPEEQEQDMDPDQGAPAGEVDMDEDEEITADDDTAENDYPE